MEKSVILHLIWNEILLTNLLGRRVEINIHGTCGLRQFVWKDSSSQNANIIWNSLLEGEMNEVT